MDFLGNEPWETPFGVVVKGENVLSQWYTGYGEIKGFNEHGVDQQILYERGNVYLQEFFPDLDYIISCKLEKEDANYNQEL